jgi:hypothetical protein
LEIVGVWSFVCSALPDRLAGMVAIVKAAASRRTPNVGKQN